MHWHAECVFDLHEMVSPGVWVRTRRFHLRGYREPGGFQEHRQFDAIAHARVESRGAEAFLSGALNPGGEELAVSDWRDLARLLRDTCEVGKIVADRRGRVRTWSTARV